MKAAEADIISGKLKPFTGPIKDQAGNQKAAAGVAMADGDIKGMTGWSKVFRARFPRPDGNMMVPQLSKTKLRDNIQTDSGRPRLSRSIHSSQLRSSPMARSTISRSPTVASRRYVPARSAVSSGAAVDLGGALVVPGFVEGHIHLDTSFYGDAWKPHRPCTNGFDVHERVTFQAQNIAAAAPLDVRASNQLELCIGHGTTQMRSHVMVDGSVGLKSLEGILRVREAYADFIDIQLVAFPQNGISA